jgi:hypothetical protein
VYRAHRVLLGLVVAVAVWNGSRDISSEDAVSTHGDMARYLMNGVFLRDLAASGEFISWPRLMHFGESYYARYPALSLGHHPPLLPALLAPAFGVFGISVFVGRVVSIAAFVVAVLALFGLANRLYGSRIAVWAAALFATHPMIVVFGQQVMAEMLMVALVCVAFWQLLTFTQTGRTRHLATFALAAALSVAARPLAVVVLPGYAAVALLYGRRSWLRRKDVVLVVVLALIIVPLVPLTLVFSSFNIGLVANPGNRSLARLTEGARTIFASHLQPVLWMFIAAACATAALRRDRRIVAPLTWGFGAVAVVLALTGAQSAEADRYSIAAVPALCLAAAALDVLTPASRFRWLAPTGLAVLLATQVVASSQVRPLGASGYETAAQWIVEHTSAPTVMFSGPVDTGYFMFFVRKHDPAQRLVVLRSDKILTTSLMGRLDRAERIAAPREIYEILEHFGTRFIVMEDLPVSARPLVWLREAVKTPRFAERLRIPQQSRDRRLQASSLVIYEYLSATAPDPDALIDIDIPLVGRKIQVPLADLLDGPGDSHQ